MSTAFDGESNGEFGTCTYVPSNGPATVSEMLNGVEELEYSDPVEEYFACITTCSLDDGECITVCTEQLRASH